MNRRTAWAVALVLLAFPAVAHGGKGVDNDCDGAVDGADPDCPSCGDGVLQPGEQCDDGNAAAEREARWRATV